MAELTVSLGPFSVDFSEKISLNIIKDKIEVNPVVLGNTNANFYRFFSILLSGYINTPGKSSQPVVVHVLLWR